MSVLVKGMDMPTECRECLFNNFGTMSGETYCGVNGVTLAKKFETISFDGRPDWCPLVALPDHHGRLVDADAFKADYGMKDDCADCEKEMQGKVRACEYDRIYSKMDFCSWLDDAYTIVESEGESCEK